MIKTAVTLLFVFAVAINLNSVDANAQMGSGMMGNSGTAWGTGAFRSNGERIYFTATSERGTEITYTDSVGIASFAKAVKALLLKIPHPSASIAPSFWDAKIPELSFAKVPGTNWLRNAHHLKVWHTNYLSLNDENIYVGMVNANDGFKWGIIPKIAPDLDAERELLYQDLNSTGRIESHLNMQLVNPLIGKNFTGDQFFTDGKAYLITMQ